jgi:hypothetical protein
VGECILQHGGGRTKLRYKGPPQLFGVGRLLVGVSTEGIRARSMVELILIW